MGRFVGKMENILLKNGQMVMLVGTDNFMPPMGAIGEVVGYYDGDYDVEFPRHPCPVPPGTFWCCQPSWLMPINPPAVPNETEVRNMAAYEVKA